MVATMTFRPKVTESTDCRTPAADARAMVDTGAALVGANCEQESERMLGILRVMRNAVKVPLAAQPAAFKTPDEMPCFTRLPEFPEAIESIQIPRSAFEHFAEIAPTEGIAYLGGCCGCNAACIRAARKGLERAGIRKSAGQTDILCAR